MKNQHFKFSGKYFGFLLLLTLGISFLIIPSCTDDFKENDNLADDFDILAQVISLKHGKLGVSDAANDGIDEFYFLSPTVSKQPKFHGSFHPNLTPIVEISDDFSFETIHTSFTREPNATNSVQVNAQEEFYFANWDLSKTKPVIGKIYRARVKVGSRVLGFVDFGVVRNANQKLNNNIIPVVENQQMRITFRIEDKICPARIEVVPEEAIILKGAQQQFTAIVYNFFDEVLENQKITWSVGNEAVASINQNGMATGSEFGSTSVLATVHDVTGEGALFVQEVETGPRPGKDIIVFNDMNPFDNEIGLVNPNNRLMVRNLVSFETIGPRANGNTIWFDCGKNSRYPNACSFTEGIHTNLKQLIQSFGFDLEMVNSSETPLIDIPQDVKVIFLWLPRIAYSLNEINNLKLFAEQGGRIVFIGEFDGFYEAIGFQVQNHFLENMGSDMRNIGGNLACFGIERNIPANSLRPHPITRDMAGVTFACASIVETGENDYPFVYDPSNTQILASVAQINTAPISELTPFNTDLRIKRNSEEDKHWKYPGIAND
jgi:hypothetical protein